MRASLLVLAVLASGCREPQGTPVSLEPAQESAPRVERFSAWRHKAAELVGGTVGDQTWAKPEGYADRTRLSEALYAHNQAIALARECRTDDAPDCKGAIERSAERVGGGLGVGLMWRRQLCDALCDKAEVLVALKRPKHALAAADESIALEAHPYNHKIRGDALYALERYREAADAYAAAGNGAYVTLLRGLCRLKLGEQEAGAALVTDALGREPSLRESVEGAASVLAAAGL